MKHEVNVHTHANGFYCLCRRQLWPCHMPLQSLSTTTAGTRVGGDEPTSAGSRRPDSDKAAVLVHPDDVVKRLKLYLELETKTAPAGRTGLAGPARATAAVRRAATLEQEFWQRMSNVINDQGTRVWGALEKQLEKYHTLLQTRAASLSEVDSLQHQNAELRALLNQYLSSSINDQLQIPPTQVI